MSTSILVARFVQGDERESARIRECVSPGFQGIWMFETLRRSPVMRVVQGGVRAGGSP